MAICKKHVKEAVENFADTAKNNSVALFYYVGQEEDYNTNYYVDSHERLAEMLQELACFIGEQMTILLCCDDCRRKALDFILGVALESFENALKREEVEDDTD
jgi:hypothetical protein